MREHKRRILIYCPEARISSHYHLMLLLGRTLKELGHQVDVAYCNSLYERCVVMDSIPLPPGLPRDTVKELCAQCVNNARFFASRYQMNLVDMAPYHPPQRLYEAARLVAGVKNPNDLTYEGINLGALALQDVVLARKLMLDQPPIAEDRLQIEETLRNTLVVYMALKDMLADRGYTDVLIMGQYAVIAVAALAAQKLGINWRIISNPSHYDNDRRRLTVNHYPGRHIWFGFVTSWQNWRDIPLTPKEVMEVVRDILLRLSGIGSHTYSPGKTGTNVLESLDLSPDRKLIVAFTSSLDERQANDICEPAWNISERPPAVLAYENRPKAFANQVEWLRFLVDWVKSRGDTQLVIRIHPREDSNKRESVRSRHLALLEEKLADLPSNVRVVWPRDDVSSYDLIEAAHLVQAAWSTIGLEAARLGVPTMASDGFNTYPLGDFIQGAATPAAFGQVMEQLLSEENPSLARLTLGMRYYALSRLHSSVNIADLNPSPHTVEQRPFTMPSNARILERLVMERITAQEIHREQRPQTTPEIVMAEQTTIRLALRLLVRHLITGIGQDQDYPLACLAVTSDQIDTSVPVPTGGAVLLHDGSRCRFVTAEDSVVKHSPMVARLAALCANATLASVPAQA